MATPTVSYTFQPQPLNARQQRSIAQENWQQLDHHFDAVEYAGSPDYAFATADPQIQNALVQALAPVETTHAAANELARVGFGAYSLTHLQRVSKLLQLHPAMLAVLAGGALFGKPLYDKLRQYEAEIAAWSQPGRMVEHQITGRVRNALLQTTLPLASKPLVALGYSLGLLDTTMMPHAWDPGVYTPTPVFRPTRWLHQAPASYLEKIAPKIKSRTVGRGLHQYSITLRGRKQRSWLEWLLYPLVFSGELAVEVIFSLIESRAPQLAYLLRGLSGSMIAAVPSVNTALSAWGGYKLGAPLGPIGSAAAATTAGLGGWYYQTLLNLANHTQMMPAYMLEQNLYSSVQARINLMPLSYEKIYGAGYYNNPVAVQQYLKDFGYKVAGTQFRGIPGYADYQLLNARHLPMEGKLGKLFGQPARLMFKHKILQTLPLRGLFLGPILGLPFLGKTHLALIAGDFGLRLLETNPVLNKIKNSALWGAGVGAELALLSGQGQYWLQYAAAGAALGASVQGINLAATADAPAWNVGPGRYVFDPVFKNLIPAETVVNTEGRIVYEAGSPLRPMANFWQLTNKGEYLNYRLANWEPLGFKAGEKLANLGLFNKALAGFNKINLGWLRHLRFLNGAWTGTLIGTQLFLLTGNPTYIWVGAAAGTGAQAIWEVTKAATRAAEVSGAIARFTQGFGKYVLRPVNAVTSLWFAASSYSSYLEAPTPTGKLIAAGLSVAAVITLFLLGVPLGIAMAIVLATLIAEAIARQVFHFSIVGWINTNIFNPIGNWLGKVFGPLFQGVFNFASDVVSAGLGFIMGLFQAASSSNLQAQVAGWATAAFSVSSIGTGLIAMVSASGFFSGIPVQSRRLAAGFLYLDAQKSLVNTQTNSANQIVSASYQIGYSYPQPPVDQNTGQSLTQPAINIQLIDEIITPRNIDKNDVQVINYSPASLPAPAEKQNPVQFVFDNIAPSGLAPGDGGQLNLEIQFSKPLGELLQNLKASAVCNRAVVKAKIPKAVSGGTQDAVVVSPTVCLDSSGNYTTPPADALASNLALFLNQCYSQSCDHPVSQKDFSIPADYDPTVPYSGCPSPDEIAACQLIYAPYYGINDLALDIITNDAMQNGNLGPLAFIQAVEKLQRRNFPAFANPDDYKQACLPGGYTYHDGSSGYQLGDIVFISQPYGVIVADIGTGQIAVAQTYSNGVVSEYTAMLSSGFSYIRYSPSQCP